MSEPRIWVLVADGEVARLYSGCGDMSRLTPALAHELTALDVEAFVPTVSELPVFDEADIWNEPEDETWGMPGMGALRDPRAPFADHLARLLRDAASAGVYDALIIAAAPHLMPSLDRALTAETRARLMGCVVDDLTHLGPTGLSAYLREHVFH